MQPDSQGMERPVTDEAPLSEVSNSNMRQITTFSIVFLVLAILGFVSYQLISSTINNNQVVPQPDIEVPVEEDPVDMAAIAAEKLTEIDQGQGVVSVVTIENKDMFLTTSEGVWLYQKKEGFCEDECLNQWIPYEASEVFEGDRLSAVLVNEELDIYYVLLDNKMLFTHFSGEYVEGEETSLAVDDEWEIVRP